MRRAIRVRGVEYYSFVRAARRSTAPTRPRSVRRGGGLTAEDRKIASRVLKQAEPLLLVANKWDLVEEKDGRSSSSWTTPVCSLARR